MMMINVLLVILILNLLTVSLLMRVTSILTSVLRSTDHRAIRYWTVTTITCTTWKVPATNMRTLLNATAQRRILEMDRYIEHPEEEPKATVHAYRHSTFRTDLFYA